jgi:hypothetical protein
MICLYAWGGPSDHPPQSGIHQRMRHADRSVQVKSFKGIRVRVAFTFPLPLTDPCTRSLLCILCPVLPLKKRSRDRYR